MAVQVMGRCVGPVAGAGMDVLAPRGCQCQADASQCRDMRRVHHGYGAGGASIHAAPRRGRRAARHDGPGHKVERAVALVSVVCTVWSRPLCMHLSRWRYKGPTSRVSSTLRSYDALKQPFSSEQGT
jgi:hypothetical protein